MRDLFIFNNTHCKNMYRKDRVCRLLQPHLDLYPSLCLAAIYLIMWVQLQLFACQTYNILQLTMFNVTKTKEVIYQQIFWDFTCRSLILEKENNLGMY